VTAMHGNAGAQTTQFSHELGAVVTTWPAASNTHGMLVLATTAPWTEAETVAPGQLTSTQPMLVTTVCPAGTTTTGGVIEVPVPQAVSVVRPLRPTTLTFRSAWPVLRRVKMTWIGALAVPALSCTSQPLTGLVFTCNALVRLRLQLRSTGRTIAVAL